MKRILVTGGCGFIGTEVVKQLLSKGYAVTVVDDLSKPGSAVKDGYNFVQVDLTNQAATEAVFAAHDVCIHLAAKIGGIGYFHKYPATILADNNAMNACVLRSAVANKLRRVVILSSSMVFESAMTFPSKESDLAITPIPHSAYGFSKLSSEWYAKAFYDEFKQEYAIVRPFNAYGPLEHPGDEVGYAHVIPDLIKKILDGQSPLTILGDGQQSRCYTHVRDIADGIITVLEHPHAAQEDFNISHAQETSVRDLALKLWRLCGHDSELQLHSVNPFQHDVKRRVPDVSKAQQILNWQAQISLDDGLPEVVEWVRSWYARQ